MDELKANQSFFLNMASKMLEKHNINRIEKTQILGFYEIDFKNDLMQQKKVALKNKQSQTQRTKIQKVEPKQIEINKQYDANITPDLIEGLNRISMLKIQRFDLVVPEVRNLYDSLFDYINGCYNTTFIYSGCEETNGTMVHTYHSACIFDAEPNNDKQVTAYVDHFGLVNITCYHEKCKTNSRYFLLQLALNKNVFAFHEYFTVEDNVQQLSNIEEAF